MTGVVKDPLVMSERDLEIVDFVVRHRACPIALLAARFFAFSARDGEPNLEPERACRKRVQELEAAGRVRTRTFLASPAASKLCDPRAATVVYSTDRAAAANDGKRARPLPARNRAHHLATLRALEQLRDHVERRGGRVLATKLEGDLRSDAQHGRPTRPGQEYDAFPDALVTIEVFRDGARERLDVAIEYVTSKYADRDIRTKAAGFRAYDRTMWFADKPATKQRVERLTGASCACL